MKQYMLSLANVADNIIDLLSNGIEVQQLTNYHTLWPNIAHSTTHINKYLVK